MTMALSCPRAGLSISRHVLRSCKRPSPLLQSAASARPFSASVPRRDGNDAAASRDGETELPRWAQTPDRMKAPFSLALPKHPERSVWEVNEDPAKLDRFYVNFLGRDGDRLLSEELKWLAVTHKSFDYGRRGFNTRLAYFGRQIVKMEAMRSVLASPPQPASQANEPDATNEARQPFEHPALANVDKLTNIQPMDIVSLEKLLRLASDTGLQGVMRWKPKDPQMLRGSGIEGVLQGGIYAVIGAIALHRGAEVAQRVCRERILKRLAA